jgi:Zn-dependent peptidase ImmA (M78 family)/DNA-binding XRE family transcriptional regulator
MSLYEQLTSARELAGYSQEDVASALGISRAMISYWESGKRDPNDRQLVALARLFRVDVRRLLSDKAIEVEPNDALILFRRAEKQLSVHSRRGLHEFIDFLDDYAGLARSTGFDVRGMNQSPFLLVTGFDSADDVRRKAEEVRAHLRVGLGPIDMDAACELLGITVYHSALGSDLRESISGAFLNHPDIGFSILVNLEMTPGRRRFTKAHELAHALLHSGHGNRYVISGPARTPQERFADIFAGEFLMPTEGIRRDLEEHGVGPRVQDPADVVHLQRHFQVSYVMALVRLRQANLLTAKNFEEFQRIRPVLYAQSLGYDLGDEEFQQDPLKWGLRRLPPRFLRLLRQAVLKGDVSVPTAAELAGLSFDEVQELLTPQSADGSATETEIREFTAILS